MATALVTTFYGALLANALFLPLAGKLETRSREEILNKEMVIDGIMAIQSGDSPRIVEEKLRNDYPGSPQAHMLDPGGNRDLYAFLMEQERMAQEIRLAEHGEADDVTAGEMRRLKQ